MEELILSQDGVKAKKGHKGPAIFVGSDAFDLLKDKDFLDSWDALYNSCNWANTFLSSPFSITWYNIFKDEYTPIIVTSEENGKLTGLLTLSVETEALLHAKEYRIKGAGYHYFEYQGWLAEEANGETFIKQALSLVLRTFPTAEIMLQYMPAQIPVDWVRSKEWKNKCALQEFGRPLMAMNDPQIPKILKKRSFKTKYNRLKRCGNLEFREVVDQEEFEAILPELALQFDFRQGAMFNKNHFQNNPGKAEFLKSLNKQGYLHTTVLQLNGEIIASLVAVIGHDWIHLGGINTHSPHYAIHSPGFVHFILLGKLLTGDENLVFDLTPGGDEYKERMATDRDVVYGLLVSNNPLTILKKKARVSIDDYLITKGKRPVSVENELKKQMHIFSHTLKNLRNGGLSKIAKQFKGEKVEVWPVDQLELPITERFEIKKNSIEDLLLYDAKGNRDTRWESLIHFMKSLERMEDSFTLVDGGKLLACAWISTGKSIEKSNFLVNLVNPDDIVLYNFYCHQEFKSEFAGFLRQVLALLQHEDAATIKVIANLECRLMLKDYLKPTRL